MIIAVVALFLYTVISDSSRSVYSSKNPIAIINRNPAEKKDKARPSATTGALNSPDRNSGVTPRNLAQTVPAKPVESVEWGWKGSTDQGGEQHAHPETGAAKVRHCSLYDVNASEPRVKQNQNANWPYREEKREPGGKVYKVKRASARKPVGSQGMNTPWGW